MAAKKSGRIGDHPPVRPPSGIPAKQTDTSTGVPVSPENISREDIPVMPANGLRTPAQQTQQIIEGVTVIGEAVRRVSSETAEFLSEVATTASSADQALRESQAKTQQDTQAIAPAGVQ